MGFFEVGARGYGGHGAGALVLANVVTLEALRRSSNAKCRPLWWGLEGISLSNTALEKWLQKWEHVRRLTECTQGLSKPMLFLSDAPTLIGCVDEQQGVSHGGESRAL